MSSVRKLSIASAVLSAAIIAVPASAETKKVKIENNSGETRKVCMHKQAISMIPLACVTLKKNEHIFWDRGYKYTGSFSAKVYQKRKILDKFLYSRDLPADTGVITIGTGGRFGYGRLGNIKKRITIRACNTRFDDTIWVAFGFDTPTKQMSEGWWSLKKGECNNIVVTDRVKQNWGVGWKTVPRLYYFARTYGDKPRYWSGGDNSRLFCLDLNKKFALKVGNAMQCANVQEIQPYRFFAAPKTANDQVLRLEF